MLINSIKEHKSLPKYEEVPTELKPLLIKCYTLYRSAQELHGFINQCKTRLNILQHKLACINESNYTTQKELFEKMGKVKKLRTYKTSSTDVKITITLPTQKPSITSEGIEAYLKGLSMEEKTAFMMELVKNSSIE